MSEPVFSIIIPVYNAAPFLERCLNSWEKQSFKDFEVILIDDGSTDESAEICWQFVNRYDHFSYYKKPNGGVSSARNMGLERAQGKYLGFCDADDYVSTDLLYDIDTLFQMHSCDLVVFHVGRPCFDDASVFTKSKVVRTRSTDWLGIHSLTDDEIMGSVCNKYIRRDRVKTPFNQALTHLEDGEWLFHVIAENPDMHVCETESVLYSYERNEESATRNYEKKYDENGILKYIPAFLEMRKIPGLSKSIRREIEASLYFFSVNNLYSNSPKTAAQKELKQNMDTGRRSFYFSKNRRIKVKIKSLVKEILIWTGHFVWKN